MDFKYDEKYLDTKEVAQKWGLSQRTIASYCRKKYIPKAYKKSNTWKIPVGSLKPLNAKETRNALFLISKIHNYLIIDHDYTSKQLESSHELSPILDYLESFGYISFKDSSNHITKVLVTEKGMSVMNSGKGLSITVEVSSLIDVVTAILRLATVLGAK
jgi:hypothetical protein